MKIFIFSLLTFSFNVNSAEIKCDAVVISSPDIKGDEDCKKNKISTKNAEVKFDDGSIYQGPIKKNKINGKGKLTLNDGSVYEGKFKSNKFYKNLLFEKGGGFLSRKYDYLYLVLRSFF